MAVEKRWKICLLVLNLEKAEEWKCENSLRRLVSLLVSLPDHGRKEWVPFPIPKGHGIYELTGRA